MTLFDDLYNIDQENDLTIDIANKIYSIDINELNSLLIDIIQIFNYKIALSHYINLNDLLNVLSTYKTGIELENEEYVFIPRIHMNLNNIDKTEVIKLFSKLYELFTLLNYHGIKLKIKEFDIIVLGYNKKLLFNEYFNILNFKKFDNIYVEKLMLYNVIITNFIYFPNNVDYIIFNGCEIKSCIKFPKCKNIKFNDTCLPNNFKDLPDKLNTFEIIISLLQWHNNKDNIKYFKEIISKYIGKLNNLPYNLKINQTIIIQPYYIDTIQKLLKTYIKKTLKDNYRENDLYKKLYRQFITKND